MQSLHGYQCPMYVVVAIRKHSRNHFGISSVCPLVYWGLDFPGDTHDFTVTMTGQTVHFHMPNPTTFILAGPSLVRQLSW